MKKSAYLICCVIYVIFVCFSLSACSPDEGGTATEEQRDSSSEVASPDDAGGYTAPAPEYESSPASSPPPAASAETTEPATTFSTQAAEPEIVLSVEDENAAREVALEYYSGITTLANRIAKMEQIGEEHEKYVAYNISEHPKKKDVIIAFEVTASESINPPRIIVLTKESGGEWLVISEGYY